ncbi:MAG: hypothetical protein HN844_09895 [Planctomycetes bacterium]|nr:hypothetical protein [Planctomycetota bacterium]
MSFFRRRRGPSTGRLVVYGPDGLALQRDISTQLLQDFLEKMLVAGGATARLQWEKMGLISSELVQSHWPPGLPLPQKAVLRSGHSLGTGMALQIDLQDVSGVKDFATDIIRLLEGKSPLVDYEVLVPEPIVPEPIVPEPIVPEMGPFAFQSDGVALEGTSPEKFHASDFEWLVPGSRLADRHRGYCRVKKVDLAHRQAILRDAKGEDFLVTLDELASQYWHRD